MGASIQSAGGRARFAIGAIYFFAVGTSLWLGVSIVEVLLLDRPLAATPGTEPPFLFGLAACCALPPWLIGLVAAPVSFLMWLHRAYTNARRLRPDSDFSYTPGYAVGCWFIPIVNLWEPFFVVRALEAASLPDDDDAWIRQATSRHVVMWWAFFLGRGVLDLVATLAHGPGFGAVSITLHLLAIGATLAAAYAAHRVITRIQSLQDLQAQTHAFE